MWQDELICQGLWDKTSHNYAEVGKFSKAPNHISPPISYMEVHGAFKPLATTTNPLGLCRFYCMDPASVTSAPTPNHLATIHQLKYLLEKAREQVQPYIIVVFKGGNVMLLSLLHDLHSHYILSCIPIFTPEEAKCGQPHISCCSIFAYIIKNDSAFLNHIVIGHYWYNFMCGKCLDVVATSRQQLKKHFLKCPCISSPQTKKKHDKGEQNGHDRKHDEKCSQKVDSQEGDLQSHE